MVPAREWLSLTFDMCDVSFFWDCHLLRKTDYISLLDNKNAGFYRDYHVPCSTSDPHVASVWLCGSSPAKTPKPSMSEKHLWIMADQPAPPKRKSLWFLTRSLGEVDPAMIGCSGLHLCDSCGSQAGRCPHGEDALRIGCESGKSRTTWTNTFRNCHGHLAAF